MKSTLAYFFCFFTLDAFAKEAPQLQAQLPETPRVFRFHLNNDAQSLDPHTQRNSAAGPVVDQLFRNWLIVDSKNELRPELAEKCWRIQPNIVQCQLKLNLKWSNGEPLKTSHFLKSYQRILNPKTKSRRADLLFDVKNAEAYYKGQVEFSQVGIKSLDERNLQFELTQNSPEFEYHLSVPSLSPVYDVQFLENAKSKWEQLVTSGPYRIKEWTPNRRITLTPQPYWSDEETRTKLPDVEAVVVPDDGMALKLFEKGELDFLKRLPTQFINQYQTRPEFLAIEALRFDYVGFGPRIKEDLLLRKALVHGVDYEKSQKLFSSPGRYGCPEPGKKYYDTKPLCYDFDLAKAKEYLSQSLWMKDLSKKNKKPLELYYSTQGGDDHRKMADWLQIEWQKNLGLRVETKSIESRIFLSRLRNAQPDLFRRGVAPALPTCRSLLSVFLENSSENYLKHFNLDIDKDWEQLGSSSDKQKTQCRKIIEKIMSSYALIPTGRYDYSILLRPGWKNFSMNSLNQIDLGKLSWTTPN